MTISKPQKGRILSIEDQPDTISGTLMTLRRLGYVIDYAQSLAEARASLRTVRFDLIIVDVLIPEIDGGEPVPGGGISLLEELKGGGLGEKNRAVPFVVATAQAAFVDTMIKIGRSERVMSSELLCPDCLRVDAKAGDIRGLARVIDEFLIGRMSKVPMGD